MTASLPTSEVRIAELAEDWQQGIQPGRTDATQRIRVGRGISRLRSKPEHYIIRIRTAAGVLPPDQLETVAALAKSSGWPAGVQWIRRRGMRCLILSPDKLDQRNK